MTVGAFLPVATGGVVGAQSCAGPDAPDVEFVTALVTAEAEAPEFAEDGMLVLPYTPEEGQLEAELAVHHPGVLENGLPERQSVWFIVDEYLNVVRTGIGESEGLAQRLRADYPPEN